MKQSELRQDLVSGDWILFAPGRLIYKTHGLHFARTEKRLRDPVSRCPFENPFKGNKVLLTYANHGQTYRTGRVLRKEKDWKIVVIQNAHPPVVPREKIAQLRRCGLFQVMEGVGHSDLIITRDHDRNFPELSANDAFHVLEVMRDRYLMLLEDKNLAYISVFHNWGSAVGASLYHPHYQMIGIPVVPPDIQHSLNGSAHYFKNHKSCVHCVMIQWEKKQRKRIIFENENAIAFAPFVSRSPFEIRIFPKRHRPYFENTFDEELRSISEALQRILGLIEKKLGDPDYNFFIHTAPIKDKNKYNHYHWHLEIYPHLSKLGGFEFSTGVEINIFDPDLVAKILKSGKTWGK